MALILCIETATTVCSVVLAKDGKLISIREINKGYTHAENITIFIDEVLKEAKLKPTDIDAVCVSKGPGSYTGLRIGVSTAKGLCYALDKPLLSINSLFSMAEGVRNSQFSILNSQFCFCPMIDARRMEVYCAIYNQSGAEVKPTCAEIIDENSFADLLSKNKIYFFGDGAEKCKAILSKHKNAVFVSDIFPSAKNMIKLAEEKYNQKQFEDVAYFEPYYLKEFIAGKKKGSE